MSFNYLVHAQHVGAGDNYLNVAYELSTPFRISKLPMHARQLLALLAIRNSKPHVYEIQCDSMAIEADSLRPEQLIQDGDYEIYSNTHCEYIKIVQIHCIHVSELSTLNAYIPCTKIHLTDEQIFSLKLTHKSPTA